MGLKLGYTLFMLVWVPTIWVNSGPANFLWLCDVANILLLPAIWLEHRLLFSSQAVSVLIIQLAWTIDFLGRLILGVHPLGATMYMFDSTQNPLERGLSLFHLVMPVLLLYGVRRLGFDRRAWKLQTLICWVVLLLSALPDPVRNLNWLHQPFGMEQDLLGPGTYLAVCMFAYPMLLYLPTQAFLVSWMRRTGGELFPRDTADPAVRST